MEWCSNRKVLDTKTLVLDSFTESVVSETDTTPSHETCDTRELSKDNKKSLAGNKRSSKGHKTNEGSTDQGINRNTLFRDISYTYETKIRKVRLSST